MTDDDHGVRTFGPYVLDPVTGDLFRAGEPVPLRPKAAAVLLELVGRAGSLVPREDLVRAAWGDAHVAEDSAVHNAIREIRQALGDTAVEPQYVATVHGRGYRFVSEVGSSAEGVAAAPAAAGAPAARSVRLRLTRGTAAAVAVAIVMTAAAFTWGPLGARGRNAVADVPVEVLRARQVLLTDTGSRLDESAEVLRASVQDSPSAFAWSALAVAEMRLGRRAEARAAAERALVLDVDHADAYRVLAQVDTVQGNLVDAERHALRAVELDPTSALAHHARTLYLLAAGDVDGAVRSADRSLSLAPWDPVARITLAEMLLYAHDYERAFEETSAVGSHDELRGDILALLLETRQVAAWSTGRFEDARGALLEYARIFEAPEGVLVEIASGSDRAGAEAALRWRLEHVMRHVEREPRKRVGAAMLLAQLGDLAAAAGQLRALASAGLPDEPAIWRHDPRLAPVRDDPGLRSLWDSIDG